MNEDQMTICHTLLKSFADELGKTPADLLELYIKDAEMVENGLRDTALHTQFPLDRVKTYKRDRKFYAELAHKILESRDVVKQYLIETGQLKTH